MKTEVSLLMMFTHRSCKIKEKEEKDCHCRLSAKLFRSVSIDLWVFRRSPGWMFRLFIFYSQARLRGTHSPRPSFINFFAPTSINMSLNIFSNITQFWTLKESGALCSVGQGQNFLLFTVEKSCETNSSVRLAGRTARTQLVINFQTYKCSQRNSLKS